MANNHIKTALVGSACLLAFALPQAQAAPDTADIAVIVDESGSMGGEHAWLPGMISDLESGLLAAGVGTSTTNRYSLVGYGGSSFGSHYTGHEHYVDGGSASLTSGDKWFSATDFSTAANNLVTDGGTEDGYQAIDYFFDNYSVRSGAALNVILVTDEDRDTVDTNDTYSSILSQFGASARLNAVVDCGFADASGQTALGLDSDGTAYTADGSGGFSSSENGTQSGYCYGSTKSHYVDLAWDTSGAAWDLGQLRAGGDTATSFTNAFVDIKVEEIQETPSNDVPVPGTAALLGIGLAGLGYARRRKHAV